MRQHRTGILMKQSIVFVMTGTIKVLVIALLTLLCMELVFRAVDPWGVASYAQDGFTLRQHYVSDPERRYILTDGPIALKTWTATIINGTRRVPDSASTGCRIAFVGDSVTFGLGVEDRETFVNLVSRQYPEIVFVNTGISGYNVADVARVVDAVPAQGYVYLLSNNDGDAPFTPSETGELRTVLLGYLQFVLKRFDQPVVSASESPDWIVSSLNALNRADVFIVGYPNPFTDYASALVPVTIIPSYTETISTADGHPNTTGHQELADSLTPLIASLVGKVCG